ncbi:uncharacterized protein [Diadema setosum]|uniref:uncharacterized protein n=1 Tax=Diadema setosum TaxID=31175 RepID=UPI003B3B852B
MQNDAGVEGVRPVQSDDRLHELFQRAGVGEPFGYRRDVNLLLDEICDRLSGRLCHRCLRQTNDQVCPRSTGSEISSCQCQGNTETSTMVEIGKITCGRDQIIQTTSSCTHSDHVPSDRTQPTFRTMENSEGANLKVVSEGEGNLRHVQRTPSKSKEYRGGPESSFTQNRALLLQKLQRNVTQDPKGKSTPKGNSDEVASGSTPRDNRGQTDSDLNDSDQHLWSSESTKTVGAYYPRSFNTSPAELLRRRCSSFGVCRRSTENRVPTDQEDSRDASSAFIQRVENWNQYDINGSKVWKEVNASSSSQNTHYQNNEVKLALHRHVKAIIPHAPENKRKMSCNALLQVAEKLAFDELEMDDCFEGNPVSTSVSNVNTEPSNHSRTDRLLDNCIPGSCDDSYSRNSHSKPDTVKSLDLTGESSSSETLQRTSLGGGREQSVQAVASVQSASVQTSDMPSSTQHEEENINQDNMGLGSSGSDVLPQAERASLQRISLEGGCERGIQAVASVQSASAQTSDIPSSTQHEEENTHQDNQHLALGSSGSHTSLQSERESEEWGPFTHFTQDRSVQAGGHQTSDGPEDIKSSSRASGTEFQLDSKPTDACTQTSVLSVKHSGELALNTWTQTSRSNIGKGIERNITRDTQTSAVNLQDRSSADAASGPDSHDKPLTHSNGDAVSSYQRSFMNLRDKLQGRTDYSSGHSDADSRQRVGRVLDSKASEAIHTSDELPIDNAYQTKHAKSFQFGHPVLHGVLARDDPEIFNCEAHSGSGVQEKDANDHRKLRGHCYPETEYYELDFTTFLELHHHEVPVSPPKRRALPSYRLPSSNKGPTEQLEYTKEGKRVNFDNKQLDDQVMTTQQTKQAESGLGGNTPSYGQGALNQRPPEPEVRRMSWREDAPVPRKAKYFENAALIAERTETASEKQRRLSGVGEQNTEGRVRFYESVCPVS